MFKRWRFMTGREQQSGFGPLEGTVKAVLVLCFCFVSLIGGEEIPVLHYTFDGSAGREDIAVSKADREKFLPRKSVWGDATVQTVGSQGNGKVLLPTEQMLKPAGRQVVYPGRPLDMTLSPDGKWAVVTNLRDVTLINISEGTKEIVALPDGAGNSFHGVIFLPDSRTIYCAGSEGEINVFIINSNGKLKLKTTHKVATRAACGLALSDDHSRLYVADSGGNFLVVCDASTLQPLGRTQIGVAPYSVAVGPNDKVYVSNWGGRHPETNDASSGTYGAKVAIDPETGVVNNGTVSVVKLDLEGTAPQRDLIIEDTASGTSDWAVTNGVLVQNDNLYSQGPRWAGTRLVMGEAKWKDYTLTCRLMSVDNDRIGLIIRRRDMRNCYRFRWQIEKYGDPCYQANIEKCVNGKWTVLAHEDIPFKQREWYTVTFSCVGNKLELSVPEVGLKLAAVDDAIKFGRIGMYCSGNQGSYFDEILVTQNGRKLLHEAFDGPDRKLVMGGGAGKAEVTDILVGRFPCQLILNSQKTFLFVANGNEDTVSVIDTLSDRVVETIPVKLEDALPFGSQPNALVLSPDERTLYVANATNNSISVIRLGRLAGVAGGPERSRVAGMIPVGWFPGAIKISHDGKCLYVANVRGLGAGFSGGSYHVGNFVGTVNIIDVPDKAKLASYTHQVAENNRMQASLLAARPRRKGNKLVPVPTKPGESSVFEHVIYIIRENHTYDQDLGDVKEGNGEPRLCSSGENLTPNGHAIAREFILLDNYHVPSVQSPTGHLWLSQGITTSYYEKGLTTWPRRYSYTGSDALAFAGSDFIWSNALKHGLTFRSYGEQVNWSVRWTDGSKGGEPKWIDAWNDYKNGAHNVTVEAHGNIAPMKPHVAPHYPGYGYVIPDVRRAQIFIEDLKKFEKDGNFPNLTMVFLPNNHTSGSRPGFPSAPAQIADNDMALGMIVDALSHSKFWPKTVIFCTEDDPWNGSDHVAGSRSLCYVISPYTKRKKVISEFYSLCGLLKTIELILGLPMMNQLDLLATPMTGCFTDKPDFMPYNHIPSRIRLDTINPNLDALSGPRLFWAKKSMKLPLMEEPDAFPEDLEVFKRLAWYSIAGYDKPYTYVKDGRVLTENPMKYVD